MMNCSVCGAGMPQADGALPPPLDPTEIEALQSAKRDRLATRARRDRLGALVGGLMPALMIGPPVVGAGLAVVWLIPTPGSELVTLLALAGGVLIGLSMTVALGAFASMEDTIGIATLIWLLVGAVLGAGAAVIGAAGVASLLATSTR